MYKSNKAISEYREGLTDLIMNPKLSNSQKELYDQIKDVFGEKEANDMAKIMLDTNQRAVKRIGIETMLLGALLLVGALVAGYVDDPDKKDEFAISIWVICILDLLLNMVHLILLQVLLKLLIWLIDLQLCLTYLKK